MDYSLTTAKLNCGVHYGPRHIEVLTHTVSGAISGNPGHGE